MDAVDGESTMRMPMSAGQLRLNLSFYDLIGPLPAPIASSATKFLQKNGECHGPVGQLCISSSSGARVQGSQLEEKQWRREVCETVAHRWANAAGGQPELSHRAPVLGLGRHCTHTPVGGEEADECLIAIAVEQKIARAMTTNKK